jgi:hypothetical protein
MQIERDACEQREGIERSWSERAEGRTGRQKEDKRCSGSLGETGQRWVQADERRNQAPGIIRQAGRERSRQRACPINGEFHAPIKMTTTQV